MTFDDAVAALEAAAAEDSASEAANGMPQFEVQRPEQAPAESAPQGESAQQSAAPQTTGTPETPAAPVDTTPNFLEGTAINPDELPAELQPLVKQLQASYTRKTQDVAQQRQQFETLGDYESLQQASQLYQQLQDPSNWPRFQREISQLMEQQGIATQMVNPPAFNQQAQQPQPLQFQQDPALAALAEYPELAPLAEAIQTRDMQMQQMASQMQQMSQTFAQQQEEARQEALQMAQIGEFQRQEGILRQNGLDDTAMSHVYEIAHAYQGNLLAAADAYEAMKNEVLASYLQSKTAVEATPIAPHAGGQSPSTIPVPQPKTLEEATDIAMEALKAQGLDTIEW